MRRLLVICLILLLPLNMFALAMAASAMQPAEAPQHAVSLDQLTLAAQHGAVAFADAYLPDPFDCQDGCDIDPDEPPAGADVHDSVNEEVGLPMADFADGVVTPVAPPRASHSFVPLLKPPRAL